MSPGQSNLPVACALYQRIRYNDEVLNLEGQAQILNEAPPQDLAERLAAAYTAKYAASGYSPAG